MRKYLFSLLLLILALSLVACGPGPASKDPDNDQSGDSLTDTPEEVSVEEQTLIDQDGIVIKAAGLDSSWLGPELKVYIENNADKAFTAQTRNSSVNGFMLEPVFSCDVMPGKKAMGPITFAAEDLEACGIDRITSSMPIPGIRHNRRQNFCSQFLQASLQRSRSYTFRY